MAGQVSVGSDKQFLLAPSILSADPLKIGEEVNSIQGLYDFLHVDVMDGNFVPNLSYGPSIVRSLRTAYPEEVLDVHLMVDSPEQFIIPFADAGATFLTVHVEATDHLHRLLSRIRELGCKPGITLNPGTPVEMIKPVLNLVDMVLVMSVNPGFGGQKFIPESLEKVISLCRWRVAFDYNFLIEIDGGIGKDNAVKAAHSGADVLVMGNAVFGTDDPREALREMRLLLKEEKTL